MPVVDTVQTFNTGDTVTSTTLNNIMDQSIFVPGAVSGTGLVVTAGGQLSLGTVSTGNIGDSQVTTIKIANGNVTPEKFSAGGPSWTGVSSGNFNVSQPSIELGTGITSNSGSFIDFHSVFPLTDYESRIFRNPGPDGILEFVNNGSGAFKFSASGGATFGNANMPNPSGTAPIYGVRAWCNFDAATSANISGSYSRSGTTITVDTTVDHGLKVGHRVYLTFTGGTGSPLAVNGLYLVASIIDSNSFTVTSVASGTITGGSVTLNRRQLRSFGNVANVSASPSTPTVPPSTAQAISDGCHVVNFVFALPDANYSGICSTSNSLNPRFAAVDRTRSSAAYAMVRTEDASTALTNFSENSVMFIG